uniref:Uncharacterized protein n=1 Tax=Anguilla anguilla TaxID=7936 RepID=A0A0E9U258_ANGAN
MSPNPNDKPFYLKVEWKPTIQPMRR